MDDRTTVGESSSCRFCRNHIIRNITCTNEMSTAGHSRGGRNPHGVGMKNKNNPCALLSSALPEPLLVQPPVGGCALDHSVLFHIVPGRLARLVPRRGSRPGIQKSRRHHMGSTAPALHSCRFSPATWTSLLRPAISCVRHFRLMQNGYLRLAPTPPLHRGADHICH